MPCTQYEKDDVGRNRIRKHGCRFSLWKGAKGKFNSLRLHVKEYFSDIFKCRKRFDHLHNLVAYKMSREDIVKSDIVSGIPNWPPLPHHPPTNPHTESWWWLGGGLPISFWIRMYSAKTKKEPKAGKIFHK